MGFLSSNRPKQYNVSKVRGRKRRILDAVATSDAASEGASGICASSQRASSTSGVGSSASFGSCGSEQSLASPGHTGVVPFFTTHRERITLESMPADILVIILAFAGNLALPQASHVLARKLTRSRRTERLLLLAQMDEKGVLATAATSFPFVTAEMLAKLHVSEFSGPSDTRGRPFVPREIEQRADGPRLLTLLGFMIKHGCAIENSPLAYVRLMGAGDTATVDAMLADGWPADERSALVAIELGDEERALALLDANKDLLGKNEIWQAAKRAEFQSILDKLTPHMWL